MSNEVQMCDMKRVDVTVVTVSLSPQMREKRFLRNLKVLGMGCADLFWFVVMVVY